jgi:2,4-dienoyl-CoA reductase-like NADH-dependent reductase (Old Yellow Enzyme family)
MVSHARIFDPIRLRGALIPNRIVMPPMTTRLAATDGSVTAELIQYYVTRAAGGTGLVTIEMASPDPAGRHRAGELGLMDDRFLPGLRTLTAAVKRAGASVSVQIGHAGGHTRQDVTGHPPVAPSAIPHVVQEMDTRTVIPRALSADEIRRVVEAFARTAQRAKDAGFDAAEIHGAHGYLIAQFLSPLDNHRTDEYGGTLENRARFALEVIRACRQHVGDFPLIFRFSADEFAPGGFTLDEARRLAPWAVEAGADALHVSGGCYRSLPSGAIMAPPMSVPEGVFLELAAAVKETVRAPVIAVGRLHDPALARQAIESGKADLVALGRQLIADPEWPRKVRDGRTAEIRPCIACNSCIDGMREGSKIRCLVNARAGRESEPLDGAEALVAKHVVVVGGGPAGMEAARLLATRKHRVTLIERGTQLGGRLRLAAKAPVFQYVDTNERSILKFVDFLARELTRTGVDVRLGAAGTASEIERLKPDVVLLAAGASYRFPFNLLVPAVLGSPLRGSPRLKTFLQRPGVKQWFYTTIRKADARLAAELGALGIETRRIGDCRVPGRALDAIAHAAEVASQL